MMTPYEIAGSQVVGNLLALSVTFVLIAIPGRSTDPESRADGSLMTSTTEHGYANDEGAALTNVSADAAAGIMAWDGEADHPLTQADKDSRVHKAASAVLPRPREETYRKVSVPGH